MRAVLISRPTYSEGEKLAKCLAEHLGVQCISRADLMELVGKKGLHARRVVESLSRASHAYLQFSRYRRAFVVLMRRAFLEMVRSHDLVYHGHACQFLVPDLPAHLRVRVNAPESARVRRAAAKLELPSDEAREVIRREDEEQSRWARFMYGKDVRDPSQYDVCVCLGCLPMSSVCAMLSALADHKELQPTPDQRKSLEDIYLAACVEETLVLHPVTQEVEVAASARQGVVQLTGPYLEPKVQHDTEMIAGSVPGVSSVGYEVGYAVGLERPGLETDRDRFHGTGITP
jgi:cytidylate kinase